MNAPELLESLAARGAVVSIDDGAILVKPREVLTDELRGEIRANKPQLLELLAHGNRFAARAGKIAPQEAEAPRAKKPTFATAEAFQAWHWRACGAPGQIAFYSDWPQFARVHCAPIGGAALLKVGDLETIAAAILKAQRPSGHFDFAQVQIVWRVADHLTGTALDSRALYRWARDILGEQE